MLQADGGGLWVLGPIHSCARDKCFRLFIRLEVAHSKWHAGWLLYGPSLSSVRLGLGFVVAFGCKLKYDGQFITTEMLIFSLKAVA